MPRSSCWRPVSHQPRMLDRMPGKENCGLGTGVWAFQESVAEPLEKTIFPASPGE